MATTASNITWHTGQVSPADRAKLLGQNGCVLWFTGLSGSGKSTIATALEAELIHRGHAAYVLDGDNVRHGLNSDLGFSPDNRSENIRRISEVAALFANAGLITLAAFISPYRADRDQARTIINNVRAPLVDAPAPRFLEVFIDTPLEVCEARDPKKLYAKARAGEISDFTGISAPYEKPDQPEIVLPTADISVDECVSIILQQLSEYGIITATSTA
jgi:adenylylsulfate kinase